MSKNTELAQAMSAKICHDLSGAIGAIDNYLGLLDHADKKISTKARELISEESANLVHQIRFFRSIYGLADNESTMSVIKITKLITDFFANSKVKMNLHCEEDIISIDAQVAKAAICLAVIVGENINNSGVIDFYLNKNEDSPIWLFGSGDNLLIKEEHLDIIQNSNKATKSVRNCREHYINLLCSNKNYQVLVNKKTNAIEYKFIKKS